MMTLCKLIIETLSPENIEILLDFQITIIVIHFKKGVSF